MVIPEFCRILFPFLHWRPQKTQRRKSCSLRMCVSLNLPMHLSRSNCDVWLDSLECVPRGALHPLNAEFGFSRNQQHTLLPIWAIWALVKAVGRRVQLAKSPFFSRFVQMFTLTGKIGAKTNSKTSKAAKTRKTSKNINKLSKRTKKLEL